MASPTFPVNCRLANVSRRDLWYPNLLKSSPEHGYQQMVVKGTVLYWDLTADPHALEWLKPLARYFGNVQHRSGLLTDAEHPHLKHHLYKPLNPAAPAMLAAVLGDGTNRWAADIATKNRADNVANRMPSFIEKNPNWYNFHHTTYAVVALRIMERHPLPDPVPLPGRRVFVDASFRGVRSHWDDFTAAVGTRRMNDSLAGAYLADANESMLPLGAAVNGVRLEVLEGDRDPALPRDRRVRAEFRCVEWNPIVHTTQTQCRDAQSPARWQCGLLPAGLRECGVGDRVFRPAGSQDVLEGLTSGWGRGEKRSERQ